MGKKNKKNKINKNANETQEQNKAKKEQNEGIESKEKIEKEQKGNIEVAENTLVNVEKSESVGNELIKKEQNDINDIKLEKIEEEIKKQTTISEKRKNKIYNRIFKNIIVAIIVIVYFIFINLGYTKLSPEIYLIDQQVFSFITLGITIIFFEKAYKKDDSEIALLGIEALALSICTLMTILIVEKHSERYSYAITTISILFAIYYVAKSIVIYCKMKNKALKRTSDIHKIGRIKE